jgi:hypothetical protein
MNDATGTKPCTLFSRRACTPRGTQTDADNAASKLAG